MIFEKKNVCCFLKKSCLLCDRPCIQSRVLMIISFKQKMDTLWNFDIIFWIVGIIFLNFLRLFGAPEQYLATNCYK